MTRTVAMLLLTVSLTSVACSQLLFKAGILRVAEQAGPGSPPLHIVRHAVATPLLWVGFVALVTGAACWYGAMVRLPLTLMMPMATLIAPTVSIAGWAIFGEPLTSPMVAAIGLIAVGAIWLSWLNA